MTDLQKRSLLKVAALSAVAATATYVVGTWALKGVVAVGLQLVG